MRGNSIKKQKKRQKKNCFNFCYWRHIRSNTRQKNFIRRLIMSLYRNIHKKRKRIKAGSKEKMRKPGSKGAPTSANFRRAAKTAKKRKKR